MSKRTTEQPTLEAIAQGIHAGTIYTIWHLPPGDPEDVARDLCMVFMPLAMMNRKHREGVNDMLRHLDMPEIAPVGSLPDDLGLVWEYLDQAGPRSINGMPQFFSARYLNKADTEKVRALVKRLVEKDKATTPEEKAHHELLFWRGE